MAEALVPAVVVGLVLLLWALATDGSSVAKPSGSPVDDLTALIDATREPVPPPAPEQEAPTEQIAPVVELDRYRGAHRAVAR